MKRRSTFTTSNTILELLKTKHNDDVFVSECKNGPTYISKHLLKMDAWVMKKAWRHPMSICYEIKASRNDFLRDEKWQHYLPYCNELYFVAPAGIIQKDELPPEAGLMVPSTNYKKLFTKKKAQYRTVDIPEDLYRYIIMCRAAITVERYGESNNIEYWQEWLEGKKSKQLLGRSVSKRLREVVQNEVWRVEGDNRKVMDLNRKLQSTQSILDEMGIDIDRVQAWNVGNTIRSWADTHKLIPNHMMRHAEELQRCLEQFMKYANQMRDDSVQ